MPIPMAFRSPMLLLLSLCLFSTLHAQSSLSEEAISRISQYKHTIGTAESTGLSPEKVGYLWALLASAYQDAGAEDKAIDAYQHALHLLPSNRANYAATLDNLGSLYLMYGHTDEAERLRKQALAIRIELGDPIEIARTRQHVAEVVLAQHRYKQAEQGARAALEVLAPAEQGPHLHATTELAALITLSYAQSMTSKKEDGLHTAQRASRLAAQSFQPGSLEQAHALMALGFAQSKTHAAVEAERNMLEGIRLLRERIGPTSPVVTEALFEYRALLTSQHRPTDLEVLDRQIANRMPLEQTPCPNCKVSVYALH